MKCPYCKKEVHYYEAEKLSALTGDGVSIFAGGEDEILTLLCPQCGTFLAAVSPSSKIRWTPVKRD